MSPFLAFFALPDHLESSYSFRIRAASREMALKIGESIAKQSHVELLDVEPVLVGEPA